MTAPHAQCQPDTPAANWTPEQFWEYADGLLGTHVRDQLRDMMTAQGLALSAPKASVEPADGARPSREELARAWLRGTWFDGDAAAFEGCGDHPEWLAALNGADALLASWPSSQRGSGVQTDYVMVPRELTAENGAKAVLIGEFYEDYGIQDERGEERWAKVAVTWTTIKAIHKMMVAHFAALSLPEKAEGREPVAYRWRARDGKHWTYNPAPEWLEAHKHEIEVEALFASSLSSAEGK